MDRFFEAYTRETDHPDNDDRRHRNDRRINADRRKKERRGAANFQTQPLLTEAEIAALLNGAR